MKVQRFYKRGDTSVSYDIPYAGDEYTPFKQGTGEVVTQSKPTGNNYTLATTYEGEPSKPNGMSLTNFLEQFKTDFSNFGYDGSGYYIFPLEGKDGGKFNVPYIGNVETPFIQIRHTKAHEFIVGIIFRDSIQYYPLWNGAPGNYNFSGKWNEVYLGNDFPRGLPDDTIYTGSVETHILTRQSIFDTFKMLVGREGSINSDGVIYDSNITYQSRNIGVKNDANTVSGNLFGYTRGNGSALLLYSKLTQERLDAILNGVKSDTIDVDDDEGTYDNDGGDGGTGTGNIPTGEDIDEPDKPGKNGASTGLVRGYVLTQAQTTSFSSWLWTTDVMNYISKLFTSNPLDSIITFSMLPYTPSTSETGTSIILGGMACTEVTDALLINEQFNTFEFTYDGLTEPVWGNALDFEKGVKIELFVPFVGIVPLDVNSVIYTKLKLKYIIDCFSGQGIVYLVSQKSDSTWDGDRKKCLLGQWTFNCKSTLPLTRNDISSIIGGAIGGITSLATGNIGGVASAVMSARPSVQRSGDVATSTAYMGKRNPYIIYTMSKAVIPKGEYGKKGRPQYAVKRVGDCEGFIQCENPRMSFNGGDGQSPTDEEIKEIYSLLEEGVVV